LLVLFGLLLGVAGAQGFELVGVKGDLGALVLGMMIATHPKAPELAKTLLSFKDLFLVGFFLQIGMTGAPTLQIVGIALLLILAVPFKVVLYFLILGRFKLRARTATLASLSLANYSEFGLIVGAVSVKNGWMSPEWLIIIAVALAITFVLASPLNAIPHTIYARFERYLLSFETKERHPEDQLIDTGTATILIFGMGRVGTGAYDAMRERYGQKVLGLDADNRKVKEHQAAGRNVILGDATDPDFWERVKPHKVQIVMLAMPDHKASLYAAKRLKACRFPGSIVATARYPDEIKKLEEAGIQTVYNFYAEAGVGFADHICQKMETET